MIPTEREAYFKDLQDPRPRGDGEEAAHQYGLRVKERALNLSQQEWDVLRSEVEGMTPRQRLRVWAGATSDTDGYDPRDRERAVLIHRCLAPVLCAVFGVPYPGEQVALGSLK